MRSSAVMISQIPVQSRYQDHWRNQSGQEPQLRSFALEESTMAKRKPATKAAGIGDDAVKAATGKSWAEWFVILDKAGAKTMSHKAIALYLHDKLNCPPWWSQMVTVAYEQKLGLRVKHQRPEGYQVSVSRTLNATSASLDRAWNDSRSRKRWLVEPIEIRTSTAKKSLRITWKDKKTSVEVNFYPKGDSKCQITVQHSKLKDAQAATRMKAFWADALDRLRSVVEPKGESPSSRETSG